MNDKDRWPLSQDGEDDYRRALLARATRGDGPAKRELMETYNVRIYTEKEKAELHYDNPGPSRATGANKRKGKARKANVI